MDLTYFIAFLFGAFCIGNVDPTVTIVGGAICIATILAYSWKK